MKKVLFTITLIALLIGSFGVSADYSDELDDTEYTWVLTAWDVEGADDVEVDDEFTLVFDEAPGGSPQADVIDDISYQYNGENYDVELVNDKDLIFFYLLFYWAIEDPDETFNDASTVTIEDGEATLESGDTTIVWDAESGLLKLFDYDDGSDTFTLELDEGFFSFLPLNPFFFIFTLFAIPFVRKLKN